MQKFILLLVTLMLLTSTTNYAQNNTSEREVNRSSGAQVKIHKIVFQLASQDTLVWKGLINNLKHIKEGWGDNVKMVIIAHGPGIEFLVADKTTQQKPISKFFNMGVEFIACENTMRQKNISKDSMIKEATYVQMGLGEIVLRQEEGWSYIKAGF
jgi:intracellular sulfur oxidation DsrE/DsrF family protein